MIDVRRAREEETYRRGILRKGFDETRLDALLSADDERRRLLTGVEELRARQNAASKEIGKAAPEDRPVKIEHAAKLKEELSALEARLSAADVTVRELALQIPNPASEDTPDGGEDDFEVVGTVGEPGGPPPLDHADFGAAMGFVESETAAEISGSRFHYLMREAVLLELALVQWVMTRLVEHDFVPVLPPVLVRGQTMEEAGFFPTDRAQVYEVDAGDLFLVGTAEVPLSGLHRDEIVEGDLPLRYAGFSTCFRREAGTYGKDTRGLFRVHQFDKVEMFSYADPDRSWDEHDSLLAIEESILADLGIPYRVVNVAARDLGAPAAKKYDIEGWLPSEGRYRELTSCSNYTDYSSRRMGTRIRGDGGTHLVHTLNGTACAVGRTLVFLFEHHQDADGSLTVPDVLRPFCGLDRIPPR